MWISLFFIRFRRGTWLYLLICRFQTLDDLRRNPNHRHLAVHHKHFKAGGNEDMWLAERIFVDFRCFYEQFISDDSESVQRVRENLNLCRFWFISMENMLEVDGVFKGYSEGEMMNLRWFVLKIVWIFLSKKTRKKYSWEGIVTID